MENQIEKRIKETMSAVFDVPLGEIDSTASPRTIKAWKGKNHLKMVESLETEFDIKFEEPEIETLISYEIIRATVMAYVS